MKLSRRHALLAGGAMLTLPAQAQTPDARAAAWLQAWDGQGTHRTATDGDQAGADWLAREAAAIAGVAPVMEEFALDRIDPVAAYVEIDGERFRGEPMFDAPDTPQGGIHGLAAGPEDQGNIAVMVLPPTAVYRPEFARLRRQSPHRAHVIITEGGAPGLALLNAEMFRKPYGPAVLQLSSTARAAVMGAAARGAGLRVVVRSRRTPAQGRNVVVTIAGRDRGAPKTVVMTPRSSWWTSTAERGGGIVCWLETLRALVANKPAGDVVFTANSGHELGHIGLDDFIARRPGWEKAATWVHYGANIGATGGRLSVQSADDDLRSAAASIGADAVADKSVVPNGETRDIHIAGGRYLTLVGTNDLFHLPQDRWPGAVDVARISSVAARAAELVLTR